MRKATFTITVPHLFTPISAFSAESKSYPIEQNQEGYKCLINKEVRREFNNRKRRKNNR